MKDEMDLKALYEKLEKEDMKRAAKRSDKGYTANDIRKSIRQLFIELKTSEIRTNILVKMIQEMDNGYPDVKYQEVRSVVKGKKLEGFELTNDDEGASIVRMV